jgi:hypothetical protein
MNINNVNITLIPSVCSKAVGVSTPGVPGLTSKLSLRVPAQMGRRETEHKGKKGDHGSCCPAPGRMRL